MSIHLRETLISPSPFPDSSPVTNQQKLNNPHAKCELFNFFVDSVGLNWNQLVKELIVWQQLQKTIYS